MSDQTPAECPSLKEAAAAKFTGCPFANHKRDESYQGEYYGEYLGLDKVLTAQNPASRRAGDEAHEEMLFIITHQTYELWFKQILWELRSVITMLNQDYVEETCLSIINNRLHRVVEIQKVLVDQIRILETMTPHDFLDFRSHLNPASGFQSIQFRELEISLGLTAQERVLYQSKELLSYFMESDAKYLHDVSKQPTMLSALERWLERTPFLEFEEYNFWLEYQTAVNEMLAEEKALIMNNHHLTTEAQETHLKQHERNAEAFSVLFDKDAFEELRKKGVKRLSYKATQAALLIFLYRDQPMFQQPFQLLTYLTDIDEYLTTWRYRHTMMVQRMIGVKIGSGGSAGYYYLKSTVSDRYKVFTDIFNLSTYLIPRKKLPVLPEQIGKQMAFYYSEHQSAINPARSAAENSALASSTTS